MGNVSSRLQAIVTNIHESCEKAGRDPKTVKIVAVTKSRPISTLKEALDAGIGVFGENYVQEALPKIEEIRAASLNAAAGLEWHFIGRLQSNKAKSVVEHFSYLHSLDRQSLASELNRQCEVRQKTLSVLIEVNTALEATKGGVPMETIPELVAWVAEHCPRLKVRGLMAFPPESDDQAQTRRHFAEVRKLAERVSRQGIDRVDMSELSMGVSGDYRLAIEEGTTMIRLGTALFGPRPR